MSGKSGRRLRITNHLSRELGEEIARHPSAPIVETVSDLSEPWDIPDATDILVTRIMPGWELAPSAAPRPLTNLRWVQTRSAGIDVYPSWLMEGRTVATGRGLTAPYIAEFAIAAILRQLKPFDERMVRKTGWVSSALGTLLGSRVGVVGYGAIGQEFVQRVRAFGSEVRVLRKTVLPSSQPGLEFCDSLNDLLGWADHLVMAVPLTSDTRGMLSTEAMMAARRGLHLVNVSRGELIDQEGLILALDADVLSHATLDVMVPEPPSSDHPLLWHPKVTVTPHISWSGGDTDKAFLQRMQRSLTLYAAGQAPEATIDVTRGY